MRLFIFRIIFFPLARLCFDEATFQVTAAREAGLKEGVDTSTPESWEKLLAAAQRGDEGAYRRFLKAILPFARSIARRHLGADALVEDAIQDALLTIHRIRHTYEPGRPVRPWVTAIVVRRAIDASRRRGRIQSRELSDPNFYETFADPEANQFERRQAADSVSQMMVGLTPKQKEALELVKLKEMSLAEASARSGQSVPSLKVNIHRAMQRLRSRFGGEGKE